MRNCGVDLKSYHINLGVTFLHASKNVTSKAIIKSKGEVSVFYIVMPTYSIY